MADKALDATTLLPEIIARLRTTTHTTVPLRALRREYSRRIKSADARSVFRLANELRVAGVVHRFFPDELIANHAGAMSSLKPREIEAMGKGMNTWDQVDTFAPIIAGPAWRNGQIDDALVTKWAHSSDRWWRRAALVCTTQLNRSGAKGDTKRTLAICEMLIDDRDDMVVKAMSWALRVLSQRDPKSAQRFVETHRSRLAPRVVREVGNKLRTGLKNPRPAR